ncbi:PQQ-like beta-propeller repeat protein [Sphingobacterium sp. SGG-5]|uniref:PQQ-like beta-propeller repeat protein n=1 Tax=Sphingobacterium sp. SGG-5 TaxID=2710881 RepID=UPI0013ED2179|nr:PQQ-like beta-propeller repeat protein [Sphingobacterium sp. SGG-5]NGM63303.1 PQQ-like beta-propeller repeat protein [Sphingobacterium sp. SGG-5]
MIKKKLVLWSFFLHICITTALAQEKKEYVFEDIGKPIRMNLSIELLTNDPETGPIAWAGLTDADRSALVGVHIVSGKLIQIDLTPYGKANSVLLFKHSEQVLYLFAGNKGRFLKYDIPTGKISTVGKPGIGTYWVGGSYTIAPNGKIYVGTFPRGSVSILDPATQQVEHLTRISPNANVEYVIKPASDADGIIYFPMGMQHGELWSYDPRTKEKKQLLPENLQTYGAPPIWRAADGKVYGKKGKTLFLCTADGIQIGETQPVIEKPIVALDGKIASHIDDNGNLIVVNQKTKEQTVVKSSFEASSKLVFSISDIHHGKLYGSSMKPGNMFSYDLKTGALTNMGRIARGGVQIYDLLSYGKGLFTSSYTGGYIEYFEPNRPKSANNPRLLVQLHGRDKQERPVQLVSASDGKIYSPTAPIKGYLGGTLVQIDPVALKTVTFKDLIPKQSYTSVTAVPETDEIFVTSSIRGGTSAKPTEKEAWVFLWDTKTQKISHKLQPIPGATTYTTAVRAPNGNIYGFSGNNKFYVFNPVKRETVCLGEVEGSDASGRSRVILSESVGSDGLLYGIDNISGNLLAINPADHSVHILAQHNSLRGARFAKVQSDGYLYYPTGPSLMRVRVIH